MKNIGGQAVIEGVMMKSPAGWSVAVRDPKGEINLKTVRTKKMPAFLKLPLIRGVVALFHALMIGVKAIEFSGSVAYQEQEGDKPISPWGMGLSIGFAIILAIVLFKFLPLFLTTLIGNMVKEVSSNSLLFNFTDGILRVGIFLFYIFIIGLWKEMKRIYQYHGAEHKVIYAYEAGEELTVENAKKYKPYHPRCGTSFLLIVMVISIMVFLLIPKEWSFVDKLMSRIVLIPVIAGLSYEVLRFSARVKNNPMIGFIVLPGLLLQRMTVREPDESQIEVALAAMNEVLKIDRDKEV
ncbi:MAG: DUF1385 domain-containing protein [Thermodesulfovibrionales bacterium]|jgi:uncharacterized protein YqhQ|nr:DUF1385 domain-containing protein [Thermodesulfovibrionales bacterium]